MNLAKKVLFSGLIGLLGFSGCNNGGGRDIGAGYSAGYGSRQVRRPHTHSQQENLQNERHLVGGVWVQGSETEK